MSELKKVLMDRDNLTSEEADQEIEEAMEEFNNRLANGTATDDFMEEMFGLEPDYLLDLLI